MADDPFAVINADITGGNTGGATSDPFAAINDSIMHGTPLPSAPPQTGALEAAGVHAAAGVIPAVGVLGGAEAGAAIGSLIGPEGGLGGALIGGSLALAGGYLGGAAAQKAQDVGLEALPGTWQDPLKAELATTEKEHPYASMAGGFVPYIATMTPVGAGRGAVEGATALQRVLTNPWTARVFGSALQGGLELGNEYWSGETPDWAKVGIATGFGFVWNRPNRIGERIGLAVRAPFGRREPTVAQVDADNVAGPGVTEAVADGSLKRNEAAEQSAQDTERTEASIIGPQLPSEDRVQSVARRLAPDLFADWDRLQGQAATMRGWINEYNNPPDSAFDDLNRQKADLEAQLAGTVNKDEQRRIRTRLRVDVQSEIDRLTAQREAWANGTAQDTPEAAAARQHLMTADEQMRDLGPQVAAAYRRAADSLRSGIVPAEPIPAEEPAEPPVAVAAAEGEAVAPKSLAEQKVFIAADRKHQAIAAGFSPEVAEASGQLAANHFATMAAYMGGRVGTAEELYRREGPRFAGPSGRPVVAEPETVAQKPEISGEPAGSAAGPEVAPPEPAADTIAARAKADNLKLSKLIDSLADQGASPKEIADFLPGNKMTEGEIAAALQGREKTPVEVDQTARSLFQRIVKERLGNFSISPGDIRGTITRFANGNASTIIHEDGHDWLERLRRLALHPEAPDAIKAQWGFVKDWLRLKGDGPIPEKAHEKYATGFEQYMREGRSPSREIDSVFGKFRNWLLSIYRTLKGLGAKISPDVMAHFDQMLTENPEPRVIATEEPRAPSLADIHEADAKETPAEHAEPVMDRVIAEATRQEGELHPPEVRSELAPIIQQVETAKAAAQPPGEVGAGPGQEGHVGEGGGNAGAESAGGGGGEGHGAELGGGGNAGTEGAGTGGAASAAGPMAAKPSGTAGGSIPNPEPRDTFPTARRDAEWAGNWNRNGINTSDDVWRGIKAFADENDQFIGDRLGKVSNSQTRAIGEALGIHLDRFQRNRLKRNMNAGEADAARRMALMSAVDVHAKMLAAADGDVQAVLDYAAAREKHKMIQAELANITAMAGRTLQIFRVKIGEAEDKLAMVNKIIGDGAGISFDQALKEAKLGSVYKTPEQIGQFLHASRKPGFGDLLEEYWINGLLSGPATHLTYAAANQILALQRNAVETPLAAVIGKFRAAMGREGTRVRFAEAPENLRMMFGQGAKIGAQAAYASLKAGATVRLPGETGRIGIPFGRGATGEAPYLDPRDFGVLRGVPEGFVTGSALLKAAGDEGPARWGPSYSPQGSIPDVSTPAGMIPLGTVLRSPSRAIAAMHSYFRVSTELVSLNAWALRTAMEEHEAEVASGGQGYDPNMLAARFTYLKSHPTEEAMTAARDEANAGAMMGPAGAFTQNLQRLVNTPIQLPGAGILARREIMRERAGNPAMTDKEFQDRVDARAAELGKIRLLRFIDPFVTVSSNIIKEGLLKRTPAGLLSQSIREDLAGRNGNIAADMAASRMIAGTALAVTSVWLAHQGYVNGSGPADPKKMSVWREAGNLPHSVRIGDMWYAVNRLGPLGLLMSVAADMHDVAATASEGHYLQAGNLLQHAFTHNILDESFLRGPSDLLKAIENPATDGERWLLSMGTSFLPFSVGMAQLARGADPYSREARTFMDSVKMKTPGLSEQLLPRISIWGQPMPSYDALVHGGVTAIYEARMNRDPVNLALLRLGVGVASVRPTINGVRLTDQQYNDYATIVGRMRKQRLDALVGSQVFQRSPGHMQHDLLKSVIDQSKTAGQGWMMARYPSILSDAHRQKSDIMMQQDEEQ